jgi:hypothetical protein
MAMGRLSHPDDAAERETPRLGDRAAPFAQKSAAGSRSIVRRKPLTGRAPRYESCDQRLTGIRGSNQMLESARQLAIDYVQVTIRDLARDPRSKRSSRSYRVALQRHFLSPTAEQREAIRNNYLKILDVLKKPSAFVCASTTRCNEVSKQPGSRGRTIAFFDTGTKEVNVCSPFWHEVRKCRAMTLVHEAAHAIGIINRPTHAPYRGEQRDPDAAQRIIDEGMLSPSRIRILLWAWGVPYPLGGKAPPRGESSANRVKNPDVYGYFAAHVWRETDIGRQCFGARKVGGEFVIPGEVIEVSD